MYSDHYKNICTLKNCSFGGPNEEFIISGSDDFRIYIWKIPELFDDDEYPIPPVTNEEIEEPRDTDISHKNKRRKLTKKLPYMFDEFGMYTTPEASCIMVGHRSIPNNIVYHPQLPLFFSSGVEKNY